MGLKLEIYGNGIGMPLPEATTWMMKAEQYVNENNGAELLILLNEVWNHGFKTKVRMLEQVLKLDYEKMWNELRAEAVINWDDTLISRIARIESNHMKQNIIEGEMMKNGYV